MIKHTLTLLSALLLLASCVSYDAGVDVSAVDITLTAEGEHFGSGITVTVRSNTAAVFTALTDENGTASFTLPNGIYSVSASSVSDDEYIRKICNGSLSDVIVGSESSGVAFVLPMTVTAQTLSNPLLIKEIYCGGCQMDDGSGLFAKDKCIILYNNSSQPLSLDSIAFAMVDPYNAEAPSHYFLNGGILDYAAEDWIPGINGIWYFQQGQTIGAYSELVVNVHGAIDNTQTYTNSVNYCDPAYYCMYDPSTAGTDGKFYNNTYYYPSPSEAIPTSHYLKTVKYGQGNAWPLSQTSPAVLIFKSAGQTPAEYASDAGNIIYPSGKQDNIIYACLRIPRSWVLDAVEIFNASALAACKKRLTPDLDNGYVALTHGYGHALVRRVEKQVDGHDIYQDTNNSSNDFYETEKCSLK